MCARDHDPYTLVPAITRTIHDMAPDQPVERASTLKDIRAEVLTPDRLNAIVFGGFAGVALLISVVGVAGVLAFSVSGRTREFGIRMALGAQRRNILTNVLVEGLVIASIGVAAVWWLPLPSQAPSASTLRECKCRACSHSSHPRLCFSLRR